MAYDAVLTNLANDYSVAYFTGDIEGYNRIFKEYLERFKWVAVNIGGSVIDYENPYDYIIEGLNGDETRSDILRALKEMSEMVKALREIGYGCVGVWEKDYIKCLEAFAGV